MPKRIKIYEVRNTTLKELYVGRASLWRLYKGTARRPCPQVVSHWDFEKHTLHFTEVEKDIEGFGAEDFFKDYIKQFILPSNWKIITKPFSKTQ